MTNGVRKLRGPTAGGGVCQYRPAEHEMGTRTGGSATDKEKVEEYTRKIAELEELNRDLMGMIENSYDALAIVDGESRLLLLNPAFERVMGLKNREVIGRRIKDLVVEGVSDTGASLKVLEDGQTLHRDH